MWYRNDVPESSDTLRLRGTFTPALHSLLSEHRVGPEGHLLCQSASCFSPAGVHVLFVTSSLQSYSLGVKIMVL